jgi:hypothetical protein
LQDATELRKQLAFAECHDLLYEDEAAFHKCHERIRLSTTHGKALTVLNDGGWVLFFVPPILGGFALIILVGVGVWIVCGFFPARSIAPPRLIQINDNRLAIGQSCNMAKAPHRSQAALQPQPATLSIYPPLMLGVYRRPGVHPKLGAGPFFYVEISIQK